MRAKLLMASSAVQKDKLTNQFQELKNIEGDVLRKLSQAFYKIPEGILKNCPGLDIQTFSELKIFHESLENKIKDVRKDLAGTVQSKISYDNTYEIGDFMGIHQNDGVTGQFDSLAYPNPRGMLKVLRKVFKHDHFRPNQLETIHAALLGSPIEDRCMAHP